MRTHQIVFRTHGGKMTVSCVCRSSWEKHARSKGSSEYFEPFEMYEGQVSWDAYNDPSNHTVEFTESDRIRA